MTAKGEKNAFENNNSHKRFRTRNLIKSLKMGRLSSRELVNFNMWMHTKESRAPLKSTLQKK
jgi:hypothetical protein